MKVLSVDKLTKKYSSFKLDDVSFELEPGRITGFIGRNGAGKTTTLKSLLNFVHPDSGKIEFFGLPFAQNELEIKKRIGFVSGGIDYYSKKKLKTITSVTSCFYEKWDTKSYKKYTNMFSLDENKTPEQLSAGMRVKYSLALALSHNAQLLILDEPTSGLDPVSRDDLLDVFLSLSDEGKTILFSTHITSDLDKCADDIIYIKDGRIIASEACADFVGKYLVAEYASAPSVLAGSLIGEKRAKFGYSALIEKSSYENYKTEINNTVIKDADLESIMIHLDKEETL
ncbi:MAG: ABC transporter ATP-binding protein [Oscillospiraceae bacterium]|nr:ABC transporter ATP-binding protein [Oscillospiraceae bacterium]